MSPYSDLITRAYGSLILSVGIALFLALNASESYGRRTILVLITLANGILMILHAYATLTRSGKCQRLGKGTSGSYPGRLGRKAIDGGKGRLKTPSCTS